MKFEVGKTYGAYDSAVYPITVIKRTDKMIKVKNDTTEWRMKIKVDYNGNEYVTDSCVPANWQECYTYSTKWEVKDE